RWINSPLFECSPLPDDQLTSHAIAKHLRISTSHPISQMVSSLAKDSPEPERLGEEEAIFITQLKEGNGRGAALHQRMLSLMDEPAGRGTGVNESAGRQRRLLIAWLLQQRGLLSLCVQLQDDLSAGTATARPLKDTWAAAISLHASWQAELSKQHGSVSSNHIDQLAALLLQAPSDLPP
ncbi:MAG: hypothetical protein SGPRY_010360, partial [Prymnesium sp.]